jgi:hypothetical protein
MNQDARWASRKFIVVILAMGSTVLVALAGKLTAEFAAVMTICVGSYQLAQGMVDYQEGKTNGTPPTA